MSKRFTVVTPASTCPVSVAELSTHLQLFGDNSYDTELQALLLTAQEYVSDKLGEFVSDTEVNVPLADFSDVDLIHQNVRWVSVKYYDVNNNQKTLDASNYVLDETGTSARITFTTVPTTSTDFKYPAFVQYTTRFDVVPSKVKHAILMTAGELFEVRTESTDAKDRRAAITVDRLLAGEKRVVV